MKITRNLLLGLAGGLLLNAAVRADDAVLPGNPYAPMVARNIFGLNPPAPVDPHAADATPPPKITPNGIMTIFGQLQVLFKVANPAKDGKPAVDSDYILSEGQSQDDIEVVKIDEKSGLVTFNNHGETQALPLAVGIASSTPGAGGGPGVAAPGFRPAPGLLRPGGNAFNGGGAAAGNYGGNNRGNGNNGLNGGGGGGNNPGGTGGGLNFGTTPTQAGYHANGPPVDPAVQTVVIEAMREQYKSAGDTAANILPVTALTPGADSGN
jgi:hypothetical protein